MTRSYLGLTLLLLCISGLIAIFNACGSQPASSITHAGNQVPDKPVAPDGVDGQLWDKLLSAFDAVLQTQAQGRQVSQPPSGDGNLVADLDLDAETSSLTWSYQNTGDYDLNGEVNQTDLTPVAIYFGATSLSPNWDRARFADGDGNGEITISDITPIAVNFLSTVDGYMIEQNTTGLPDDIWLTTAQVALEDLVQTGDGLLGQLKFTLELPEDDTYFQVKPYNNEQTGVPGNVYHFIPPPPPGFSLSGVCRDLLGAGLPWILVSYGNDYSSVTDAEGNFEITGLPDGTTGIVTPRRTGVEFAPPSNQFVIDGQDVSGLEFLVSTITTYGIYLDEAVLAGLNDDIWSTDYRPGIFIAEGKVHDNAGFRYRGGTIRDMPKKSWKISLSSGNKFNDDEWGYKRNSMNLNSEYIDGSLLREMLSYSLIHDMGLVSPRARFIKLYVNDEYYGLHTDVENPRKDWIQEFGYSGDGPLYQGMGSRMWAMPEIADYKTVFEKKMLEEEPYDDLALFIESLNSWEPAEVNAQFQGWIDVEQLAKYMVMNCLIQQADQIEANYFWYLDITDSNKWLITPWDHDRTWGKRYHAELGLFSNDVTYDERIDYGTFETSWGNVVYDRYLSDPVFLAQYYAELQNALDTYFAEDLMLSRIDEYEALVLDAVLTDPLKWSSNEDYPARVEDLREYVRMRRQFIAAELP